MPTTQKKELKVKTLSRPTTAPTHQHAERSRRITEVAERVREVATQLKEEYFNIDSEIDEIARMLTPFFATPHILRKPLLINLWGMTGTGKTAMIKRFIALMNMEARAAYFDMGEFSGSHSDFDLREKLTELAGDSEGEPVMVVFDEMQTSRTVAENGTEITNTVARALWEFMDTGKVTERSFGWSSRHLKSWGRRALALMDSPEFVVRHNIVVSGDAALKDYTGAVLGKDEDDDEPDEAATEKQSPPVFENMKWFISPGRLKSIISANAGYVIDTIGGTDKDILDAINDSSLYGQSLYAVERSWYTDIFSASEHFATTESTKAWVTGLMENITLQRTFDLNPCVIINMGNLDEVYTSAKNNNPDIDADTLSEVAKTVTLPQVKQALLRRFRAEQIARLGHNHVIYPSLGEEAYQKIIARELLTRRADTLSHCGIDIAFDESVNGVIYRETVFPTQGARCVLTGMSPMVDAYVPWFLFELQAHGLSHGSVSFSKENSCYLLTHSAGSKEFPVELKVEKIRHEAPTRLTAVVAVHEASHAVAAAVLTGVMPSHIQVSGARGVVGITDHHLEGPTTAQEILDLATVCLAGAAGEKVVFGLDCIFLGDTKDNHQASGLVSELVRDNLYQSPCPAVLARPSALDGTFPNSRGMNENVDSTVVRMLDDCAARAAKLVSQNIDAILDLSIHLVDKGKLTRDEIEVILAKHEIVERPSRDYLAELRSLVAAERPLPGEEAVSRCTQ